MAEPSVAARPRGACDGELLEVPPKCVPDGPPTIAVLPTSGRSIDAGRPNFVLVDASIVPAAVAAGQAVAARHGLPVDSAAILQNSNRLTVHLSPCDVIAITPATIVDGAPPTEVARLYPGADIQLVRECWRLVLALAVAWRFEPGDDLPDGAA